jgi:hypothetical protein
MNRYTEPDFVTASVITIDTQYDVLDGGPLEIPGIAAQSIPKTEATHRGHGRPTGIRRNRDGQRRRGVLGCGAGKVCPANLFGDPQRQGASLCHKAAAPGCVVDEGRPKLAV